MDFITDFQIKVEKVEDSLARIEKNLVFVEKKLGGIEHSLKEVLLKYDAKFSKMMEGFKCIQNAFRLNCAKQMELNENIEDLVSYGLQASSTI